MKALGYPHFISIEKFRYPNFEFIANCLYWLIMRYDPSIYLEKKISNEESQINFVKSATKILLAKAKIKLSEKKVYSADGYAIKELLKVASFLHTASNISTIAKDELTSENKKTVSVDKPLSAKSTRILVNEITKCGTALYDMLNVEPKLKKQRDQTATAFTNMDEMEHNMQLSIKGMTSRIATTNLETCLVEKIQRLVHNKCEKYKTELEQSKERLITLQNVRPTFITKYNEMQVELHDLFQQYIENSQNKKWLSMQIKIYNIEKPI